MTTELELNLQHSRSAYLFSINSLPKKSQFPVRLNGFEFKSESQIKSMEIELGWSFFCRYEACLENHIKSKNIKLSKKLNLKKWLTEKGVEIPDNYVQGLDLYRQIRNHLHHEDGASIEKEADTEIHLFPEHMENFFQLFVWCGEQIEKCS